MTKDELLDKIERPCPWCGSKDLFITKGIFAKYAISCGCCHVDVEFPESRAKTRENVIKTWNKQSDKGKKHDKIFKRGDYRERVVKNENRTC